MKRKYIKVFVCLNIDSDTWYVAGRLSSMGEGKMKWKWYSCDKAREWSAYACDAYKIINNSLESV